MTKKRFINYDDLHAQVLEIANKMQSSGWKPDYIVGLTRGGLMPAVMLSHWFGVPCETLKVSLRDGGESETNCWMPEDAFGYSYEDNASKSFPDKRKNILVVDDINDTGDTINWIKKDWQTSCMPNAPEWRDIWHGNVKFAVLVNNLSSKAYVDYSSTEVNKAEDSVWLVFPWEEWWRTERSY